MIEQLLMLFQYGAYGFGAIGSACFLLLAYSYWRNQRKEEERLKRAKAEIADMTLLFKTMRDIIKQQKAIAREFNEEIDSKMAAIKHLLEQGVQRNERLYDRQQELTARLRQAQEDLSSIQRQTRFLREDNTADAGKLRGQVLRSETPTEAPAPPPPPAPRPKPAAPSPEPVIPEESLKGTGVTQSSFSEWVGIDFQELGEPAEESKPPVAPPDAPEDAEAARQAFRTLLDLDAAPPTNEATPDTPKPETGSNGSATRLRNRVMEYSDAGMTVPEIARELGIGKGEVRLALSLAKQKRS